MAPSIWTNMVPRITDVVISIGADLARSQVRAAMLRTPEVKAKTDQETPPGGPQGCPYCAVTKNMAIAFRYLMRAEEHTRWGPIYQELALNEVRSATETLLNLRSPDLETLRLTHNVHVLEVWLTQPLSSASPFKEAATRVWSVSDQAIALAERFQAALHQQEAMASELEQAADDLARESKIIEGQARVVG